MQRGLLLPRISKVIQWVRGETMGDLYVHRGINEENQKVSAHCPHQQRAVVWTRVSAGLMSYEAISP